MRKHPAKKELKQAIGRYVRATRKGSGLNQTEFAKIIGPVCMSQVGRYERGEMIPPGDVVLKMQTIFAHLNERAPFTIL